MLGMDSGFIKLGEDIWIDVEILGRLDRVVELGVGNVPPFLRRFVLGWLGLAFALFRNVFTFPKAFDAATFTSPAAILASFLAFTKPTSPVRAPRVPTTPTPFLIEDLVRTPRNM
jgi:hypothetical protein